MKFPRAGWTRELVFPCLSPCAGRVEKARGLVTPCRVTFERGTRGMVWIPARNHHIHEETPVKALKVTWSSFQNILLIVCMVILYGGNSCSGLPYVHTVFHDTIIVMMVVTWTVLPHNTLLIRIVMIWWSKEHHAHTPHHLIGLLYVGGEESFFSFLKHVVIIIDIERIISRISSYI